MMKPTHDNIIEAKDVYSQLPFRRYKGKFMLRNSSPSVYTFNENAQCGNSVFPYHSDFSQNKEFAPAGANSFH